MKAKIDQKNNKNYQFNEQEYQSEFLEMHDEINKKLKMKDEKKNQNLKNVEEKKNILKRNLERLHISKNLQEKLQTKSSQKNKSNSFHNKLNTSQLKKSDQQYKKQFVEKMKKWTKEKMQLERRRKIIEEKNQKQREQQSERQNREKQEEKDFCKMQKKKQIEKKIQEISERRLRREQSLKNAVLKRSYNGVPKYLEYEQKFIEKEDEQVIINLKLLRNKKQKMEMNPEELRVHEKAYIQRIKERLKMNLKNSPSHSDLGKNKANSDFNVYLKKSQELKKIELEKLIRKKKFQEKLSHLPILVDDNKKKQVLISIDKTKNPQKYNFLSQRSLNDKQIYEEFKDFEMGFDGKQIGKNYLKELKNSPHPIKLPKKSSSLGKIKLQREEVGKQAKKIKRKSSLKQSLIVEKKQKKDSKMIAKISEAGLKSERATSYFQKSLLKSKQKDEQYMNALKQKLNHIS